MAKGEHPTHRIIRKNEGSNKWDIIGAGWQKDDGKVGLIIELERGKKISALLVKNNAPQTKKDPEDQGDEIPF